MTAMMAAIRQGRKWGYPPKIEMKELRVLCGRMGERSTDQGAKFDR